MAGDGRDSLIQDFVLRGFLGKKEPIGVLGIEFHDLHRHDTAKNLKDQPIFGKYPTEL